VEAVVEALVVTIVEPVAILLLVLDTVPPEKGSIYDLCTVI
jgi:hypothetical protein